MVDSKTGRTTKYYYDTVGRITSQQETTSSMGHSLRYTYNDLGQVERLREYYKNGSSDAEITLTDYSYEYGRVKTVTNNNFTSGSTDDIIEQYTYDNFDRVTEKTAKYGSTTVLTETITYSDNSDRVATLDIDTNAYGSIYQYTYDGNGNIVSIRSGVNIVKYVYDSQNQLIRENNPFAGYTWVWTYDNAGNITSKKEYDYTTADNLGSANTSIAYRYDNATWGDLLTTYNGKTITYDAIGNPLNDGTWNYIWSQGRQLTRIYNDSTNWYFHYDANGMRYQRYSGGNVYTYLYNGSQLSRMTYRANTLWFTYSADGKPLTVNYNGTTYYYVTNLQGDVVQILNSAGTQVVYYTYDAWGRVLSTTGTLKDTLGLHNPLRYRGYVYDQETGLYYLQSRYYNPIWGRFINADGQLATGNLTGMNLFAYCNNNPVNLYDPTGEIGITTLILIGSAIIGLVAASYTAYVEYQAGFDTAQIIGDSVIAGMSAFMLVYSMGMTAYQCYQNFCYLNSLTPLTEIGGQTNSCTAIQPYYPPNNGFVGTPQKTTLEAGTLIQRTGNLAGRFVAPAGTPQQMLSLPYDKLGQSTTILQVQQPVEALGGQVAPWFGQIGGGTQYLLNERVDELISQGILTIFGG